MTGPGLLGTLEGFVGALRTAGVPAGTSEVLDATRVLGAVDLLDRGQLRAGLAATLVKRSVHRPAFDTLFDLWWPVGIGPSAASADRTPGAADGSPEDGSDTARDAEPAPVDTDALRAELRDLLLSGDEEALRRFARRAVDLFGRAETQPGRQSWF